MSHDIPYQYSVALATVCAIRNQIKQHNEKLASSIITQPNTNYSSVLRCVCVSQSKLPINSILLYLLFASDSLNVLNNWFHNCCQLSYSLLLCIHVIYCRNIKIRHLFIKKENLPVLAIKTTDWESFRQDIEHNIK